MATTGTNTAAQWNAAANKALAAAARADLEAFNAEQAVLSAKIREERARDEYLTAQQRGDPVCDVQLRRGGGGGGAGERRRPRRRARGGERRRRILKWRFLDFSLILFSLSF